MGGGWCCAGQAAPLGSTGSLRPAGLGLPSDAGISLNPGKPLEIVFMDVHQLQR